MELMKRDVDYVNQEAIRELAAHSAPICLSIYMPTHRRGSETEQDPIRLKNLIGQLEEKLSAADIQRAQAEALLEPLQALLDDREFWQHQSKGLALFRTEDWFRSFRLPLLFDEQTIIGKRPYIKPLIPFVINNGHFYLLALSQNEVRFFRGTRQQMGEIDLGETPTSLDEAMRFDEFEDQLQFHTQTGTGNSSGGRAAVFHGHSNAGDEAVIKENIKRFLNRVDDGVHEAIHGANDDNRVPLILAGVDMMCGLYNEVSKYPTIVDDTIAGNVETLEEQELHAQAWALVEPTFRAAQQEAMDAYLHLSGTDDPRASTDLEGIVAGAYFQRIDTLFLPEGMQQWGTFDQKTNEVHLHENVQDGDAELLDFAAVHTMLNGGTVYTLAPEEMPTRAQALAIYRHG